MPKRIGVINHSQIDDKAIEIFSDDHYDDINPSKGPSQVELDIIKRMQI